MDIINRGEGGGGGVPETTVNVEELEGAVPQADVSDSREEAAHFDRREAADRAVNFYLREYISYARNPEPVGRFGCGFYKVPAYLRRQAGTEAGFLYDPQLINFRKISDLLLQQETEEAQRQISLYSYPLYYYNAMATETIESYMQRLDDYQKDVNNRQRNLNPTERQLLWVDPSVSLLPQSLGLLFAVSLSVQLFNPLYFDSSPGLLSDLLLVENQIPLFRLACTDSDDLRELFRNMGRYFAHFIPLNETKCSNATATLPTSFRHVLHFVHEMLLPNDVDYDDAIGKSSCWGFLWFKIRRQPRRLRRWLSGEQLEALSWRVQDIPTVTRLVSAGVQFKPVEKEGFVVEFNKGVLKLPRLLISLSTKKMLANLIAWEKCHEPVRKYFINYVFFMDRLIKTTKDVEILIENQVFDNSLPTYDEVKTFFVGLGQGLDYTDPSKLELMRKDQYLSYLEMYDIFPKLTDDVNKYYQSRRNKWLANLMQEYFKSPWSIISFLAACVLLVLTAVQTIFAAK